MNLRGSFIVLFSFLCVSVYSQNIFIDSVRNNIATGPLTANKNLSFGVKNILAEVLQDKGLDLLPKKEEGELSLVTEIYFFDITQTNTGVSVFKKQSNTTVMGLKGSLYKNGKLVASKKVEEASSEVVMANLVIPEDGKPNQQSVSNVIKKACQALIDKLL
jgi:hypothetical protein